MTEGELFMAALQIADPAERSSYLDRACAGDTALRQRVVALLAAIEKAGSFMQNPPCDAKVTADGSHPGPSSNRDLAEGSSTFIGPYKLVEQIGEGGMGVVWMAQQTQPVKRLVALKLVKAGMDSKQVIARFEAERQALALMDHPNIARVLDAGTTFSGRPYFVMDLVKGVPITKYCDEYHLTPRQRLELLVPVCKAVQHAHQKGIIHRDLKPTNVIVALYDGRPVPKVIDFGVAKAAGQPLTEQTLVTGFGNIVGTLEYMSPEQAELNQLDIDTRSDIYSLGVLLYELLTGSPPFSRKELEKAGMLEMLRVIREQEPSKPSTKLSTAAGLPTLAANRGTEPAKLTKLVRGELDWIVMKALDKDRNRRYETANDFANDLQRYLNDEQVLACPPSMGYRLRKLVRRNKGGLAVAAMVLFFLILLGSGVGWLARDRATRQSRITAQVDQILDEVDRLERGQRWTEALAASQRADSLTADGADATTQERVRQAIHVLRMIAALDEVRLGDAPGDDQRGILDAGRPRLYAAVFREFGIDVETLTVEEAAARLRLRSTAAPALVAALDDWARADRLQRPEQSRRLWALSMSVDSDPWRASVRKAATAMDVESLLRLANDSIVTEQPPQSQILLASSLRQCGQLEPALALLTRACEAHPADFWIHWNLSFLNCVVQPPRFEAAIRHSIAARALRPRSREPWFRLGYALGQQGKLDEAIVCYHKAIEIDPKYAAPHTNLGNALRKKGMLNEAIAAHQRAITLDPNSTLAQNNLGSALFAKGRVDDAIAAFRKAIELDPKYAFAYVNLGAALLRKGNLDGAVAAYRKAIDLDHGTAAVYYNLGNALKAQGKLDDAIVAFRKAIELDPNYALAHVNLGNSLRGQGKLNEALATYRQAILLDPKNAIAHYNLGDLFLELKKPVEATTAFQNAIELNPTWVLAYIGLGNGLADQNKMYEAAAAFRKAIELQPNDAGAHDKLGLTLEAQGKLHEAIAAYKKAIDIDPNLETAHRHLESALNQQKRLKVDEPMKKD